MKNLLLLLAVLGAVQFLFFRQEKVSLGPGVLAPDAPWQHELVSPQSMLLNGFTVTPLAEIKLKAKVLSREDYYLGTQSDLSPVDLALGWGPMSDESVLADIEISQSNRWYHWRSKQPPIPIAAISAHSANMHLIPADPGIKRLIKGVRVGDLVELSGDLVRVDASNGWHWVSSLSRTDTGDGSCELVLVKSFQVTSPRS